MRDNQATREKSHWTKERADYAQSSMVFSDEQRARSKTFPDKHKEFQQSSMSNSTQSYRGIPIYRQNPNTTYRLFEESIKKDARSPQDAQDVGPNGHVINFTPSSEITPDPQNWVLSNKLYIYRLDFVSFTTFHTQIQHCLKCAIVSSKPLPCFILYITFRFLSKNPCLP